MFDRLLQSSVEEDFADIQSVWRNLCEFDAQSNSRQKLVPHSVWFLTALKCTRVCLGQHGDTVPGSLVRSWAQGGVWVSSEFSGFLRPQKN